MNNSQNVNGNNNTVANNQFQFFNHNQKPDIIPYEKYPVTLFNKQAKTFWLIIGAAVSFAANMATIYSALQDFKNHKEHSVIPVALPVVFFFLCMLLYKNLSRGSMFKFKAISIANYNGRLFFEKYKGTCPCGGKLRFFQNLQTGQAYAQCMANDDHLFPFSPKEFDKENYATT